MHTHIRSIYGSSGWNWSRVILLAVRVLRWLLDFCKICSTLLYVHIHIYSEITSKRVEQMEDLDDEQVTVCCKTVQSVGRRGQKREAGGVITTWL